VAIIAVWHEILGWMTEELEVRQAVAADGVAIGEAHAASWLAAYGGIFEVDFLDAAAESRRTGWPRKIRDALASPDLLLVGIRNGRVVAFAHSVAAQASGVAEITGFYCHPDAWGTGVSGALMADTKRTLAHKFGHALLWTLRDAARARRFYEKMGFELTGNTRDNALTNWTTGASVERPSLEYTAPLADP
jgi:GNAT superfamily N-acetyltransferase